MGSTLLGQNEAETRLRATLNQANHGGIEYPTNTNSRGYVSGGHEQYTESKSKRERHAEGDVVGNQQDDEQQQQYSHGGNVARGGSNMSPDFGGGQSKQRKLAEEQVQMKYANGGDVSPAEEFNRRSRAPLMRK